MANWRAIFTQLGAQADEQFEALRGRLQRRLRAGEPVQLLPYQGYGTQEILYCSGRELANRAITPAQDNDTIWANLLASYSRFRTDEVPGVRVTAHFQGAQVDAVTDDEGYFSIALPLTSPPPASTPWHTVDLTLADVPIQGTADVLVPPAQCAFGVISDIDDTIVQTHATNLLKMARVVFLGNARTRLPFAGVAAFYQALHQGVQGNQNPLFFVSSSPWNIYDLLVDFMNLQSIPRGPLFLRDYDLNPSQLSHQSHKLTQIRRLLTVYPHLPFLLIGDSGQEDPEIYRRVVTEFPGRISAIYIRDVSHDRRDAQVRALAKAALEEKVDMLLVPDTVTAARHAAEQGWIDPQTLPDIEADRTRDKQAPTQLEQLMEGDVSKP
jgi:phosphatidate phosphatase APP1